MNMIELNRARAAFVCAAALALGAGAAAQSGYATKVDLNLKDADLNSATHALTVQSGIKFVIAGSAEEFRPITLRVDGATPDVALRYICESAGATWTVDENGVYIIRHKDDKPAVDNTPPSDPLVKEPMRVQKIMIMKADPKHIYNLLVDPAAISVNDSLKQQNDIAVNQLRAHDRIPAAPLVMVGNGNTQNTFYPSSTFEQPQNSNSPITLPDENASLGGGFGGGQGGPGFGGSSGTSGGRGGTSGGQGFGQGGGGGAGSATGLQPGQGLVPSDIQSVMYDPTDNSLIVRGTDEAIRQLEQLVAQFDNAPKQVIVKVEFITTSTSIDRALGIDWFYQRGSMFAGSRPGTFARAADPIFLNYATGNISTRLRTLLTEGWGRTVTSPLVRTLNNQTATIFNSATTTIFINTVTSGLGGIIITPTPVTLTATTFLSVTPRINGDQTITVFLSPQLQGFGQLKRGPDGQEIPDVLTQSISVVARVKSGETIALGGLTNKVDNYSQSRIPILSDLPIIGQLFKGRDTNKTSSELIVFVTPTIVDENNYGLGP